MDLKQLAKGAGKSLLDKYLLKYKIIAGAIAGGIVIFMVLMSSIGGGAADDGDANNNASIDGIVNGGEGGISLTTTMFDKATFKKALEEYYQKTNNQNFYNNFLSKVDTLYDESLRNNVNPEVVVVTAKCEGNFTEQGGSYNYWGIGVYNGSSSGGSYSSFANGIAGYANTLAAYNVGGSYESTIMQRYEERKDAGCDSTGYGMPGTFSGMQSVYSDLGKHEYGSSGAGGYYYMDPARAGVTKIYKTHEEFENKCHKLGGEHAEGTKCTNYERGQYTAWQVETKIDAWNEIFGKYGSLTTINTGSASYNSDFYGGINIYNSDGSVNESKITQLDNYLTSQLHTTHHYSNWANQGGPFPKWWTNNGLQSFQCTWWANGRASQYLELSKNKKYNTYPTRWGNGGEYYQINKQNGWFKYGSTPKKNSIVSWTDGGGYGHVAYVEAVDATNGDIWISHAGSGNTWNGITKATRAGGYLAWPNWGTLNGFIYLDEPN